MSETTMKITTSDLVREVRKIAAEKPDFRYKDHLTQDQTQCVYNPTGGVPSCIIGRAFINLGQPVDPVWEGSNVGCLIRDYLELPVVTNESRWLMEVQRGQDTGETWGNAVSTADRLYPHV